MLPLRIECQAHNGLGGFLKSKREFSTSNYYRTVKISKPNALLNQHLTTHRKTRIAELLTCTRSHGIWEPSHRQNCFKRPRARRCLLHTSHGDCEYNDHNDHEPIGSDRINRIVLHTSAASAPKIQRGSRGSRGSNRFSEPPYECTLAIQLQ